MRIHGRRILIRPRVKEEKTTGDIILPKDNDSVTLGKGYIVAVGDELTGRIVPGPEVSYQKLHAIIITHQGETLHLIDEEDLLVIY